ncbi:MAG TPA: FAD-dependent oxidoreductase, partial [Anaerolineales bacterium]|nr:FAD-dependent oxidoreductase [Anaerolineales bacterium]
MAKNLGGVPKFSNSEANGMKVAVVGGGPSGLAATASLAQMGYAVDIFDARDQLGGMMALIPDHRLDKKVMETDIDFILSLGEISTKLGSKVEEPKDLLAQGYNAVCIAAGLWDPIRLGIENEDIAITMVDLLARPDAYDFDGRVAVIGGGATALDSAIIARVRGAKHVELFMLETLAEMPLTTNERAELLDNDIEVNGRIRVSKINTNGKRIAGMETIKVELPQDKSFAPANVQDISGTEGVRTDVDDVIVAIGMRSTLAIDQTEGLFFAGDMASGPTTVVEASASGK